MLHAGTNSITLTNTAGSWALYDDIRLESGAATPAETVRVEAQGLPWLKRTPAGPRRVVKVSGLNLASGSLPAEVAWTCAGQSGSQKFDVRFGDNEVYVTLPDIEQKAEVGLTLNAGGKEVEGRRHADADPEVARLYRAHGPHGHRLHRPAGAR